MSIYRVPALRGANMIAANPRRLTAPNGLRWATGRNVKGEVRGCPGRYAGVEVWALKHRVNGKAVTVASGVDRGRAEQWIEGA